MNEPITDQAMREWTARAWKEAQAKETSMNRDNIIRMAREAGGGTTWWPLHSDTLERFAALVEKEVKREASFDRAELCLKRINKYVLEERAACAKACEEFDFEFQDDSAGSLQGAAAAIRARGQA